MKKLYVCFEMRSEAKNRAAYLNGCALPRSRLCVRRHCPARRPTSKNMIQLPKLAITQHTEVKLVISGRVAREGVVLDSGDEQCGWVCVVEFIDQVSLLSAVRNVREGNGR
jgi:hypothetical protein